MALTEDDLSPVKKPAALRPLDKMSIDELRAYIEEMKIEIRRVEAEIARKESHRAAADSFFRKT
ncbi:MAG: DUF1192 domain-containing protein [Rhodospirillales bacterium]|nr:DUF1192 domain-containing protein [Rhodospirillales bacterium]